MKINETENGLLEVWVDPGWHERLERFRVQRWAANDDGLTIAERAGWGYSTAPHLLILCDWANDAPNSLLQITLAGPLRSKALEEGVVSALQYSLSDEILDQVQVNPDASTGPEWLTNGAKCDGSEIYELIRIVSEKELDEAR